MICSSVNCRNRWERMRYQICSSEYPLNQILRRSVKFSFQYLSILTWLSLDQFRHPIFSCVLCSHAQVCTEIAQEEMKEVVAVLGIAPVREIHVKKLCNLAVDYLFPSLSFLLVVTVFLLFQLSTSLFRGPFGILLSASISNCKPFLGLFLSNHLTCSRASIRYSEILVHFRTLRIDWRTILSDGSLQ